MPRVLITGGARRIGAEFARRFAAEGFDVALHYRSSAGEAEALRDALTAQGGRCTLHRADLADRAAIDAMWTELRRDGPIDLCLNNASMFENDDLSGWSDDRAQAQMAVNALAPAHLGALMATQPEREGDRLVLNMLDNKVFAINPDYFTYTLSKSALLTATQMMAMKFGGRPRVCGIAPSITLISGDQTEADFERTARLNPLGRRVFPSDIADAAVFLWRAKGMTGQVIRVDGGQSLWKLPRDVAYLEEGDLSDA